MTEEENKEPLNEFEAMVAIDEILKRMRIATGTYLASDKTAITAARSRVLSWANQKWVEAAIGTSS